MLFRWQFLWKKEEPDRDDDDEKEEKKKKGGENEIFPESNSNRLNARVISVVNRFFYYIDHKIDSYSCFRL